MAAYGPFNWACHCRLFFTAEVESKEYSMGAAGGDLLRVGFDRMAKPEFHEATVSSDAGQRLARGEELEPSLGLDVAIAEAGEGDDREVERVADGVFFPCLERVR